METSIPSQSLLQAIACRLAFALEKSHVRVFMYHRFNETSVPRRSSAKSFRAQLELIKKHYTPVTFSEAARHIAAGRRVDRPFACITVDDGHSDFFKVALPILKSLEMPSTMFITTGFIDGNWLWTDALEYLTFNARDGQYVVQLPTGPVRLDLGSPVQRRESWRRLTTELKWNNELRHPLLEQLQSVLSVPLPKSPTPEYVGMRWEDVRKLPQGGVEIGAHTISHSFLPGLDDGSLQKELADARLRLEKETGTPVTVLAYPNGTRRDVDDRVVAVAKAHGYVAAAVAYKPDLDAAQPDPFRIGRWGVNDDMRGFCLALSGASLIKRRVMRRLGYDTN